MTPLRIFAIKATHNVDFARFSQPLNGFPHCFQHIVESTVEKKREDSSSESPCTRTSCVCFFHKSDPFIFPLFPSAHLDFPRFFPHLYVFHSTKFPLFPCCLHFHISTFFPHASCGREMSQHARKNLLFHKLTSSTTTILFLISISSHLSSASRNLAVHTWKTHHL